MRTTSWGVIENAVLVVVVMRVERKVLVGEEIESREDLGKGGNEFLEAVSKCRVRASHANRMAG